MKRIAGLHPVRVVRPRVRPRDLHLQHGQVLLDLRAADLQHRGLRARRAVVAGGHAQQQHLQRHDVDFDARDAAAHAAVLQERLAARLRARRHVLQDAQFAVAVAQSRDARALVAQQVLGVGPALVLLADEIGGRHAHVFQPDLVDVVTAVQRANRPHRDARRTHVDKQHGDAALRPRLGVGAHQAEHPVGVLGKRGPGLLAIDDVFVAVAHGARLERRQVRPGTGLGIALAPPVLYADHARQKAGLLLRAAVFHQHGADHRQAERQQPWRARLEAFHFEDQALQGVPARAAVLDRPVRRAPALVGQDDVPAHVVVAFQPLVPQHLGADVLGQFVGGEGAHALAELALLRRPGQVHGPPPLPGI